MRKKLKKVINCLGKFISKVYHVISVLSTLAIFSALLLFLLGRNEISTSCDDDLIMARIKEQIPENLTVTKICMQDIHGFGNESIIVLAYKNYLEDRDESLSAANQLLIFDKIDNSILNQMNNLYGYGSNYKLSYIFSLDDPYMDEYIWGYSLELLDIVELTGDLSKEIIVKFYVEPPSTARDYKIGIFSYSFDRQCYYMLGTFPPSKQYQLNEEWYWAYIDAPTRFHETGASQTNYYDSSESFYLESGTGDDADFFIYDDGIPYLIRTLTLFDDMNAHPGPHRRVVSVFAPIYNSVTDELEWHVYFSRETEAEGYPTREFIMDFIHEKGRLLNVQ